MEAELLTLTKPDTAPLTPGNGEPPRKWSSLYTYIEKVPAVFFMAEAGDGEAIRKWSLCRSYRTAGGSA